MSNDPWKILGLKPTKDTYAINGAWRKLASMHHPDHGGDEEKFKELKAAHEKALELSTKIIEIKRPPKLYLIRTKITCVQALHERTMAIRWNDDTGAKQEAEVKFPIWHNDWGRTHALLVRGLETANGEVDLRIDITLEDTEELFFENGMLIWRPKLDLLTVLKSREIVNTLNTSRVTVDQHGRGVLYLDGFLNKEGVRSDILVDPDYIWPEKYE